MTADLERATALARAAAQAILDVKVEARAHRQTKADASPVTAADLAADRVLRDGLAGDDVVVSEEAWTSTRVPASGRVWIVDPLDGTEDFVAGRPDYVVQVGLVVDGVPRLGVICQPETGRVWRGVVDDGFCESIVRDAAGVDVVTRRSLASAAAVSARPRIAVSVSHPSSLVDFIVADLDAVVVPTGSVGLKIGLLVDGGADLYVTGSRRIKVWDTLAPVAVLLAAGGVATTLTAQLSVDASGQVSGQPIDYAGDVIHGDGLCCWSAANQAAWGQRLADAVRRFESSVRSADVNRA